MLAEITNNSSSSSSSKMTMPDWEAERDTLFREKYPCPTNNSAGTSSAATECKIRRVVKRTAEKVSATAGSEEVEITEKKRRRTQPKRYVWTNACLVSMIHLLFLPSCENAFVN